MNPQRPVSKTRRTPWLALLALLTGLAAFPATAAPTLAACSWNRPGHNPFTGDVAAAVDRYPDIAPATRARLKARMARRDYDEIVTIGRDSIVGRARYGAEIRDMHFGADQVCRTVNRSGWAPNARERGLVYCEDGQCILVPTVCRNVSRIRQAEPTVAGVADAKSGTGGGGGGGGGTAAPAGPNGSSLVGAAPGTTTAAPPAIAAAPGDALAPVAAQGASGASDAAGSGFGGIGAAPLGAPAPGVSATASWVALGGAALSAVAPTASDTRPSASRSPAGVEALGGLPSGGSADLGSASLLSPIAPPVPEPGTGALWTAALGVLGWRVRRASSPKAAAPSPSSP